VIDGGYKPSQLVVFKYEDEGVATLEDGLWVLEKNLKDPAFVAKMAKFVKASMKGWDYAKKNPDEAVKIILAGDSTGAKTEKDQKRMMTEIGRLLGADDGKLDVRDYDRTVATLMSGGVRSGDHQEARGRLQLRRLRRDEEVIGIDGITRAGGRLQIGRPGKPRPLRRIGRHTRFRVRAEFFCWFTA
jgi:hypothetical protein